MMMIRQSIFRANFMRSSKQHSRKASNSSSRWYFEEMRFRVWFFYIFFSFFFFKRERERGNENQHLNTITCREREKRKDERFVAKKTDYCYHVRSTMLSLLDVITFFLPWTSILTQLVWENHTKRKAKVLVSDGREKKQFLIIIRKRSLRALTSLSQIWIDQVYSNYFRFAEKN